MALGYAFFGIVCFVWFGLAGVFSIFWVRLFTFAVISFVLYQQLE